MTMTDTEKQNEQALLFMEAWGTGELIDDKTFHGYAFVISDYAPEFVNSELPEYNQHSFTDTVTVMSTGLASKSPGDIEGYTSVYSYPAGEKECPFKDDPDHGENCSLCEGDNYIYWGDDWGVHVLVKDPSEEDEDDDDEEDE